MEASFDAETSSPVNLTSLGADTYSRDPNTRCLMAALHPVGDPNPPFLWREGDPPPYGLVEFIAKNGYFTGWNVMFFDRQIYNRILVPRHGWPVFSDDHWKDSMHLAAAANLPRSLDGCAKAVGMPFDANLKDSNRIRRITDANRTPIPATVAQILDHPERFDKKLVEDLIWLAERCVQDVLMEEGVLARLPPWPAMKPWLAMPAIDRRINDRGVMIDLPLVRGLARAAAIETTRLDGEMAKITDGAVPRATNIESLKMWLIARGVELPRNDLPSDDEDDADDEDEAPARNGKKSPWKLRKNDIADLMARTDVPEDCRLALNYRTEGSKASTAKLKVMAAMADENWRLRGIFLLGGAQQTLRFCLAEGSMVMVKDLSGSVYEKPIETVSLLDLVWDGDEWVAHEGVVFSGEKEVIEHDGVVATEEHKVYVSDTESVTLGEALREGKKLFSGGKCKPKIF